MIQKKIFLVPQFQILAILNYQLFLFKQNVDIFGERHLITLIK